MKNFEFEISTADCSIISVNLKAAEIHAFRDNFVLFFSYFRVATNQPPQNSLTFP